MVNLRDVLLVIHHAATLKVSIKYVTAELWSL